MHDVQLLNDEQIKSWAESQVTEFKTSFASINEGLMSLCAMLNAEPATGRVVFGIADNGVVRGLDKGDIDRMQRNLVERVGYKFDPQPHVQVHVYSYADAQLIEITGSRPRSVVLYEFDGRAYIREGTRNRVLNQEDRAQLNSRRNRDLHNGPWKCDTCGSIVGQMSNMILSNSGVRKNYRCSCGGEFWPA